MSNLLSFSSQQIYDWKIFCPRHQSELISHVCLENNCKEKIKCRLCIQSIEDKQAHKLVRISDFFETMQGYVEMKETSEIFNFEVQAVIEGVSLQKKKQHYLNQAETVKNQLNEIHVGGINQAIEKLKLELNTQINLAKDHIIHEYQTKVSDIFSNDSLKNKQFKNRACKIILSQLRSHQSGELQKALHKLHTGKYEVTFAKEVAMNVYQELNCKIDKMIATTILSIKRSMDDFSHFFKQFEKKSNLVQELFVGGIKDSKINGGSSTKTQVSMLRSETPMKNNNYGISGFKLSDCFQKIKSSPSQMGQSQRLGTASTILNREIQLKKDFASLDLKATKSINLTNSEVRQVNQNRVGNKGMITDYKNSIQKNKMEQQQQMQQSLFSPLLGSSQSPLSSSTLFGQFMMGNTRESTRHFKTESNEIEDINSNSSKHNNEISLQESQVIKKSAGKEGYCRSQSGEKNTNGSIFTIRQKAASVSNVLRDVMQLNKNNFVNGHS